MSTLTAEAITKIESFVSDSDDGKKLRKGRGKRRRKTVKQVEKNVRGTKTSKKKKANKKSSKKKRSANKVADKKNKEPAAKPARRTLYGGRRRVLTSEELLSTRDDR